jgi:hypothetical protein
MTNAADAQDLRKRREAMLWAGVFAGPSAWSLDLGLSYLLVWHARRTGHVFWLSIVTAAALGLASLGAAMAWRVFGEVRGDTSELEGRLRGRARFMALSGLVLSVFSALLILAQAVPMFILRPVD